MLKLKHNKRFEFAHYASVLSIMLMITPNIMLLISYAVHFRFESLWKEKTIKLKHDQSIKELEAKLKIIW